MNKSCIFVFSTIVRHARFASSVKAFSLMRALVITNCRGRTDESSAAMRHRSHGAQTACSHEAYTIVRHHQLHVLLGAFVYGSKIVPRMQHKTTSARIWWTLTGSVPILQFLQPFPGYRCASSRLFNVLCFSRKRQYGGASLLRVLKSTSLLARAGSLVSSASRSLPSHYSINLY